MPIVFDCVCGKRLRAKDSSSGRAFPCPACGEVVEVPVLDAVDLGIKTGGDEGPFDSTPVPVSSVAVAAPPSSVPRSSQVMSRADYLASRHAGRDPVPVSVVDLDVPFGSLVWLLFKFEFASVLAAILVCIIVGIPALFVLILVSLAAR